KQQQDDDEADEQQGLSADLAARRQRIEPARQAAHLLVGHRVDARQGFLRRDGHLLHLLRDFRPLDEGLDALALLLRGSLVGRHQRGVGLRYRERERQQQPSENLLHLSSFERDGATAYASRKSGIKSSKPHPPTPPGNKKALPAVLHPMNRRNFVKLAGLGGVVFASGLARGAGTYGSSQDEFFFVQLSDTHWGFQGPAVNPDAAGTLPKAIAAVNDLETQPDFVVFTGDLTHTTDDPRERRRRLAEFRDLARGLKNPNVRFMPGEHDAALDDGAAYQELFGP